MSSYKNIWDQFILFHSTNAAQKFLYKCYIQKERKDAKQKSYTNCYPFLYYLEHGKNFYVTAQYAPVAIKPVLLFYGMTQLLKACLLTADADYPESTSVLAHGVSTRKRKKQGYEFLDDEVKVQKYGLFTHFSEKMFHVKQITGEKFQMRVLLQRISELHELFETYYSQTLSRQVSYNPLEQTIFIPIEILDDYHMTLDRFIDYITKEWDWLQRDSIQTEGNHIQVTSQYQFKPLGYEPLMFNLDNGTYRLPTDRGEIFKLPEIMSHYLLLYNLSMISRYETEWWGEFLHSYSSDAYPFIMKFLSVTAEKVPLLLYEYIFRNFNIHFST
ncbi:YaaC family protein [Thermaerobacillus caldiproteolyticus]|uniref:YaaC family protein n=1 Tax=Thermaerobacillus caldiproteolyticus TaxID=247480 RepID=UPI0018F24C3D|nr:YaaC family protein [Anoxybacillus caldiproteolyticus]